MRNKINMTAAEQEGAASVLSAKEAADARVARVVRSIVDRAGMSIPGGSKLKWFFDFELGSLLLEWNDEEQPKVEEQPKESPDEAKPPEPSKD